MTILIVGAPDVHTEALGKKIEARGNTVYYIDSTQFPDSLQIAFDEKTPCNGRFFFPKINQSVSFSDVKAVYWYCFTGNIDPELDVFLWTLFQSIDCFWVNPPQVIEHHRYKSHQLKIARQAGLTVPDTLMTNHPESLKSFIDKHSQGVICKPFTGYGLPRLLTSQDMEPTILSRLNDSPTLFQENIEGTDIRVHLIGDELFPVEIRTTADNYKTDHDMVIEAITVPEHIASQCRKVAQTLGMVFAGIDFRRTSQDDYVFFEANPSPQYMIFGEKTGQPLTQTLASLLHA